MDKKDLDAQSTETDMLDTCECKVSRITSKYGLEDLFRRLLDLWLGKGCEEHSIRELQREINVSVLRSALEDVGEETLVGEAESKYEVLTSDEYTIGEKTEIENYLSSNGINVESLRSDFVSHQTVANHFYDCLGEKKGRSNPSKSDDISNVRSFEKMAETRLEQIVERLRNSNEVDISEDYRIKVDFYVVESDGSQVKLTDLIQTRS